MRCLLLLSAAVLAIYAASDYERNAIYYKMTKACEDVIADLIAKDEAWKRIDEATDGFSITAEDKQQLKPATQLLKGIVANLGLMPVEVRGNFKGLCDKSKIFH